MLWLVHEIEFIGRLPLHICYDFNRKSADHNRKHDGIIIMRGVCTEAVSIQTVRACDNQNVRMLDK